MVDGVHPEPEFPMDGAFSGDGHDDHSTIDPHDLDEDGRTIDVVLRGSLPCIRCGYELQGLTILGGCPECGQAVRATILYRVDPQAEAFRPLPTPRLTAAAVVLWPLGALLAVLIAWIPRLSDMVMEVSGGTIAPQTGWTGWAGVGALALSGLATLALIRPTQETQRFDRIKAVIGTMAYVPLAVCWWGIAFVVDAASPSPYLSANPNSERLALRICIGVSALATLLLIRPNTRQLVARSLVLRTGRVDRQTIFATAGAVGLGILGDGIRLASTMMPERERFLVAGFGSILILVASLLVTLALIGATIDGWRICRAILIPGPRMAELLRNRPETN